MAKGHGKKAKVYVSGIDISSYLKSASSGGSHDLADSSGLGNEDKEFLLGMQEGKLSIDGMYSIRTKAEEEALAPSQIANVLEAAFGTSPIVAGHMPQGDAFGSKCLIIPGAQSSVEISTPYSDVGKIAGELTSNMGISSGVVLKPLAVAAATGEGEKLDLGAAPVKTEHGGVGMLQVGKFETGNIVVKIQHSPDNVTFTDLITFTAVTASEKAEAIALPSTTEVKRYVRAIWTHAAGNATFHVAFARNP